MRKSRTKVRRQLKELRTRLKELGEAQQRGEENTAEIESCKGEIQVYKKELQSIEEGGHTTFVAAKDMLQPKKGISAKNLRIQFRKNKLNDRISNLSAKLGDAQLPPDERETILEDITKLRDERDSLIQEKQALNEYNHTRFMQFRKEAVDEEKHQGELLEIEKKIADAETSLDESLESGEDATILAAKENLHLLLMEKTSIENFTHDLFLQNMESMKAKR